jgi:hypothetical protein
MVHLSFAFVASGFAVDGLAGPCKAHIDWLVKSTPLLHQTKTKHILLIFLVKIPKIKMKTIKQTKSQFSNLLLS